MTMAGGFLGGARDRLLPASIPFRFFLAAALFHFLAWLVLFIAADGVAGFRGGPGPVLAAIHLLTLGVLALTAIGASYQLFPVVTRRPLARDWPARVSFWLTAPGILLLAWGMGASDPWAMKTGGIATGLGLAVFVLATADNLRRAGSVAVVAAHAWAALAALIFAGGLGLIMVWDLGAGFLDDHAVWAVVHMAVASFGFMGFLVFGLSLVLIPMFVLSLSLPQGPGWAQVGFGALALAGFVLGALLGLPLLLLGSLAAAFAATLCYFWLMRRTFRTAMRKRLGLSFVLIRTSWLFLALGLLLILAPFAGIVLPNGPALTGFVILAGWLLTFLTGVLQRIMPFLASMHASGRSGLPALMSELSADTPLKIHAACHITALAACALGIVLDTTWLIRLGAALGAAGALAFAVFAVNVVFKLAKPQ